MVRIDLHNLYRNEEKLNDAIISTDNQLQELQKYKGNIHHLKDLETFIVKYDALQATMNKIISYVSFDAKLHQDSKEKRELQNSLSRKYDLFDVSLSFFQEELCKIPFETLNLYISQSDILKRYQFFCSESILQ